MDKIYRFFSWIFLNQKTKSDIIKGSTKLPGTSESAELRFNIVRTIKWALFYVAVVMLMSFHTYSPKSLPKLNEVARFDIVAPFSIKMIDEDKTEGIREELRKSVPDKFKLDKNVLPDTLKAADEIFNYIKTSRGDNQKTKLSDEEIEKRASGRQISFNSFKTAINMPEDALERVKKSLVKLFETIMSLEIHVDNIQKVRSEAAVKVKMLPYEDEIQKLIQDIFEANIRPNYVYDKEATRKQREKLVADIEPVERHIKEGEIIVRHGEIIKAEHIDIFKKFNIYEPTSKPGLTILSAALLMLFSIIVIGIYLYQNQRELLDEEGLLTMLAIIVITILVIAKLVDFMMIEKNYMPMTNNNVDNSFFSPYMVPTSAAAILIALLIDTKLAFIVNIIIAILVEMIMGHSNLNFLIVNILSGTVAILSVKDVNHRADLTRAGIMVSFTNVYLIATYALIEYNTINSNYYSALMKDCVWGFFNGFISTIFSIGMLPYLESVFKVSTSIRLLEFSDLNQPLLRKLLLEAPGTYHHSIIVGNLAEAAAKDIGADALLCRVGAYYHDIGKLKNPLFFIENQNCGQNIHDGIKPHLSARAIMSHTKAGYEIGLEAQLPQEILDIILQHHGTNLISYFYSKALSVDAGSKEEHVEEEYRYLGPKPQTREAAIILLADAIEAASRTLSKPSSSAIESLVKRIKNDRFNDGQFDDCNITLKDLEKISNTFVRIITGMYHSRIEYPDQDKGSKHKQHHSGGTEKNEQAQPPASGQQSAAAAVENGEAPKPAACEIIANANDVQGGERKLNENLDN